MDVFKTQFIDKLTAVHGLPRGRNLEDMLTIYREQLDGETHEIYEIAVKSLIQNCNFWPKIPECINAIKAAKTSIGIKLVQQQHRSPAMTEAELFSTDAGKRALKGVYANMFKEHYDRHGELPSDDEMDKACWEKLTPAEIEDIRNGHFDGKPFTAEHGSVPMLVMIEKALLEEARLQSSYR